MKITLLLSLAAVFGMGAAVTAEDSSKFEFEEGGVPDSWAQPKGEWKVTDGVLHGSELASDKHAAVLTIPQAHKDSAIRFRFRMADAKMFALSYNHPKGHLFRVSISNNTVNLVMDKNKKDPTSKAISLQKETVEFKPGEWVEMSCKVTGEQAEVTCGKVILRGTNPRLLMDKTGFRLIVKGEAVEIDDIEISGVVDES